MDRTKTLERLYSLDLYEARDNDETHETLNNIIDSNPDLVINYLLDIIEEMEI